MHPVSKAQPPVCWAPINLNTLGEDIDSVLGQAGLQLRQGDLYLNRLGAEQLNAQAGDVVEIFIGPLPVRYRVKAIVEEAGPMGALLPVVMLPLDEAQKLLFMDGKVNNVLISNLGDDQGGLVHTDAVSQRLRVLAMDPAAVERVVAILRRPAVRTVLDRRAGQAVAESGQFRARPAPFDRRPHSQCSRAGRVGRAGRDAAGRAGQAGRERRIAHPAGRRQRARLADGAEFLSAGRHRPRPGAARSSTSSTCWSL